MNSLFNRILTITESKYIVRHIRRNYPEKKGKQYIQNCAKDLWGMVKKSNVCT